MNILAVGGAGYIGSHVVRELLDNNHQVTIFDNLSSGSQTNLFSDATFIHGDILNYEQIRRVMEIGFDAFIHLAAFKAAGESMITPQKYSVNNIFGTLNLLNAASETGIKRIVFSSSAAVYGAPQFLPITEEHTTNPENYYGFTKLEIERFLNWYDRLCGIKFAALRYFNAAGYDIKGRIHGLEKNPQNLLPIVMEVASGIRPSLSIFGDDYDTPDGTCIRDYVHVNDLAKAHLLALEYIDSTDRSITVNLGSEHGISVKTMVEQARIITGKEIPATFALRRVGDPSQLVASSENARTFLNWKPSHSSVEHLISSTWDMYKNIR